MVAVVVMMMVADVSLTHSGRKKIKGEGGWVGGPAAALVEIILSGDALKLANELELKHFTVNKTRECLPIYTLEEKERRTFPPLLNTENDTTK